MVGDVHNYLPQTAASLFVDFSIENLVEEDFYDRVNVL
jgi:hypothetical protein